MMMMMICRQLLLNFSTSDYLWSHDLSLTSKHHVGFFWVDVGCLLVGDNNNTLENFVSVFWCMCLWFWKCWLLQTFEQLGSGWTTQQSTFCLPIATILVSYSCSCFRFHHICSQLDLFFNNASSNHREGKTKKKEKKKHSFWRIRSLSILAKFCTSQVGKVCTICVLSGSSSMIKFALTLKCNFFFPDHMVIFEAATRACNLELWLQTFVHWHYFDCCCCSTSHCCSSYNELCYNKRRWQSLLKLEQYFKQEDLKFMTWVLSHCCCLTSDQLLWCTYYLLPETGFISWTFAVM